jgi:quercetin dioxygenase-like cupin family protein
MTQVIRISTAIVFFLVVTIASARAQAVAGPERAKPVQGDPGISSMVVLDRPEFRILRDYAEPGATRRMHSHDDATYHVFVLITGTLRLTIEGEPPVEVHPGEARHLKGGARHTFFNTGTVTSTIVEVLGQGGAKSGDAEAMMAFARVVRDSPERVGGTERPQGGRAP